MLQNARPKMQDSSYYPKKTDAVQFSLALFIRTIIITQYFYVIQNDSHNVMFRIGYSKYVVITVITRFACRMRA